MVERPNHLPFRGQNVDSNPLKDPSAISNPPYPVPRSLAVVNSSRKLEMADILKMFGIALDRRAVSRSAATPHLIVSAVKGSTVFAHVTLLRASAMRI
jgi:hypothetical protein